MKKTMFTIVEMLANLDVADILNDTDISTLETSLNDKINRLNDIEKTDSAVTTRIYMSTVDEINSRVKFRFYADRKDSTLYECNKHMTQLIPSIVCRVDVLTEKVTFTDGKNTVPNLNKLMTKSDKERICADVQAYIYNEISKNELCRRIQSSFGIDTKVIQREFRTVCTDFCTKVTADTTKALYSKKLNTAYIINSIGTALHLYHYRNDYKVANKSLAIDIDYIVPQTQPTQPEKAQTALTAQAIATITEKAQPEKVKKSKK